MFSHLLSKTFRRTFILFLSVFILISCGGGGETTSINLAPTASNVTITDVNSGSAVVNDILNANYTYTDAEGDAEGTATFRWLRDGSVIINATDSRYTLMTVDVSTSISVEVTPMAMTGTTIGDAVVSASITVENPTSLTGPRPSVIETDLSNTPDHEPYTSRQTPHQLSNAKILPDGRIVGRGRLDASEINRLFSTKPEQAGFYFLTPNRVRNGLFSYPLNTAIYLKDKSLFSIDSETPVKISGDEKVNDFWLSENEKKVFFIANRSFPRILNEATGKYYTGERNQLFVVDLETQQRVRLGANNLNSLVFYNNDRHNPFIHDSRPRLLPDESRVVYVMRNESTQLIELHSTNVDGTGNIILNDNLIAASKLDNVEKMFTYALAPDSSKIIYRVLSETGTEVFSVAPDGTNKKKIVASQAADSANGFYSLFASQEKSSINITANSSRLLFLAQQKNRQDEIELYSAKLDGSSLIKVSNGSPVSHFTLPSSPQSNAVIYAATDPRQLFSTTISGDTSTQLSSSFNFDRIEELVFTDNNQAVVYTARDPETRNRGLYLTKLDASSTINLSGEPGSNGGLPKLYRRSSFMLDPLGDNVVYLASSEQKRDTALYTVKLDGSGRVKVTPDRTFSGFNFSQMVGFYEHKFYFIYNKNKQYFSELYAFDFNNNTISNMSTAWPTFVSEDASYLSDLREQRTTESALAFTIQTSTSSDIQIITTETDCQITAPENTRGAGSVMIMESSGDSLYYTLTREDNSLELYKASTRTCESITINDGSINSPKGIKLSPDEANLVYTTDTGDLFATANDGSSTQLLNSERSLGGVKSTRSGAFSFSPDASRIIYLADQDTAGTYELYSVTMDGLTTNKINAPLVVGGEIYDRVSNQFSPKISKNSQWVVYNAQQDSQEYQLYKSRLDGSENTLLSDDIANSKIYLNNSFDLFEITNDSTKVVYLAGDNTSNHPALHVSNLEGTLSSIQITPTLQPGGGVSRNSQLVLTSDSRTVVYRSRGTAELRSEIFAAKLDGSGIVKLNLPMTSDQFIVRYNITADNTRIVYLMYASNSAVTGLYASNLDGSGKILLQDNILGVPVLTNDGHVVYRAVINGVKGIYTQLITGSVATLIFEVPEERSIQDMFLTGNSQLNIFGDLRQFGVIEKFSFDL